MTQVGQNRQRIASSSSGILSGLDLHNVMLYGRRMSSKRVLHRIRQDVSADFHLLDWKFLEISHDIEESVEYADLHIIIYDCKSLKYNRGKSCVGVNINVVGRANTMDISDVGGTRQTIDKYINKVTVYLATRRNIEVDKCDGFICDSFVFRDVAFNFGGTDIDITHCKPLNSSGTINGGHGVYGNINYDKLKEKT